jgi:hypothetical protein
MDRYWKKPRANAAESCGGKRRNGKRTQTSFCAVAHIPMSLTGIDKSSGKAYKNDPRLQPLQVKLLTSNDGKDRR